jgi:hypothetical protein
MLGPTCMLSRCFYSRSCHQHLPTLFNETLQDQLLTGSCRKEDVCCAHRRACMWF